MGIAEDDPLGLLLLAPLPPGCAEVEVCAVPPRPPEALLLLLFAAVVVVVVVVVLAALPPRGGGIPTTMEGERGRRTAES